MPVRLLLVLAAVLLVGFAPAPFPGSNKPKSTRDQLERLQGKWVRTRIVIGGRQLPVTPVAIIIAGKRLIHTLVGAPDNTWALTLDAGKTPWVFDTKMEGANPPVTFVGIYRLKGNTLTVCSRWSKAEKDRPTDFDGSKPGVWLEVFQRQP